MTTNHLPKRNWIRFAARFIATVAASYWGVALLGHLVGGEDPHAVAGASPLTGIILVLLVLSAVIMTFYAWRDERRGGIGLATVGLLLSVFALLTAGRNHLFAILVSGAPFLLGGVLFLLSDLGEKSG